MANRPVENRSANCSRASAPAGPQAGEPNPSQVVRATHPSARSRPGRDCRRPVSLLRPGIERKCGHGARSLSLWTRTRRPVAVLTCACFLQQCGRLEGRRGLDRFRGCWASVRARSWLRFLLLSEFEHRGASRPRTCRFAGGRCRARPGRGRGWSIPSQSSLPGIATLAAGGAVRHQVDRELTSRTRPAAAPQRPGGTSGVCRDFRWS
jgi:hypothetical protein